jgi:16S rRNA (guanine527-N7)-methyltransferase
LELIESNFKYFKEIILFLGKSGKELLEQALTKWEFDYKERNSLTSSDSIILKIENLKKKK